MVGDSLARALLVAAALAVLVCVDLGLRARTACHEGEKYLLWHRRRDLQREEWDAWLRREESRLGLEAASGKIAEPERRLRALLARAERDERVAENPLKYAVRWFETARQFSPPPTPWSRRAAARLGEAKALWRRELAAAGVDPDAYRYE
ncbi:MAG: hypothetical protein HY554_13220 [Elusimicrobia bacterium]|nr:hypothetical protein [Elusimicrobiota bacterium]